MEHDIRPWGEYWVLEDAPTHKVKRIQVNPGGRLSLQYHHKRAEVWTIVSGIGTITIDDEIKDYAQTYSKMKPKEAAAIFDSMTDNLSLIAKILNAMDAQSRGNILGKMDSATAAKVTKIMNPSQN